MASDIIEKAEAFIRKPVDAFRDSRSDSLGEALKYYAVLLAVYSVFTGIMIMTGLDNPFESLEDLEGFSGVFTGVTGGVLAIILTFIVSVISTILGGLFLHIAVYLAGGRKGTAETLKAMMYGSTPGLLLGWIPIFGVLFGIWAFVLEVLGIRELHEISTGRAILSVVLAFFAIVVIVIFVGVAVFAYFISAPVAA